MSRIRIEVNGEIREVEDGQDILSACTHQGVEIPHFCWHDALGSVGACRLCAVRLHTSPEDAEGTIEMACMTPVADGQRIEVADAEAEEMRAHVIEWLMRSHPHDCAVCEEGGACHLQDMTVATGHHARRYDGPKRTHENQDLGPLLTHEMNRCIACYRCTRFYRQYAGGRDLDVMGAHDRVYFGRYEDGPLDSPFAGNLSEVCPTGVFNDKGWSRDYARKWDMSATPSVCSQCAVGCNIFAAERGGRLRRLQNRYNGAVNGHFLCDRGRFGALHLPEGTRLRNPTIAGAEATPEAAIEAARAALGRGAVAIASPRATLETNFALRQLVGPDHVFAGVSRIEVQSVARMAGLLVEYGAPSLTSLENCDAALVLGEDLTGTAPRAALSLRQTARNAADALAAEKGVPKWLDNAARVAGEGRRSPIAVVTTLPDALDEIAAWPLRRAPDEVAVFGHAIATALRGEAAAPEAEAVATALRQAKAPALIAGLGTGRPEVLDALAAIAEALEGSAQLFLFPPEVNSMGVALMGVDGLEGAVETLEAGKAETLVIAEVDLFERVDGPLVERALAAATEVVVLDSHVTAMTGRATIAMPVADWAETAGTVVNHEGRAQRRFAAYAGAPQAAWRVLASLSDTLSGWRTLDDVLAELAAALPHLAPARDAAPNAILRTPLGKIARAGWRISGRTAHDQAGGIVRNAPQDDPDSALAFSMEGAHGADAPSALRTGYDVPGLHSASAAPYLTDANGGSLDDGDPGVSVLAGFVGPEAAPQCAFPDKAMIPVPLHDPFTGDEVGRKAEYLSQRCPQARVVLNPDDAKRLHLGEGTAVSLDGVHVDAVVAISDDMPRHHVGLPVGRVAPRALARSVKIGRQG
ncbi:NADH-ubiquinone oxidoreductase chain G [Roseibacterium elongatum DSM 19469]|uniref:NADH-ubiquinone oxidoreductase chain G n=1 Tax=Roseicyclus elongatus DSM 19469 TaxID=1294273 RepID=W8RN10_9RHOB|nr:NADH-quinone oxidoreductase subunit NuoG [Roseibacterium elongatum]AHM02484.1 NADH-ubiquinone oxidoreductase chain G [Roseibacterium elongatum DSM 19469]